MQEHKRDLAIQHRVVSEKSRTHPCLTQLFGNPVVRNIPTDHAELIHPAIHALQLQPLEFDAMIVRRNSLG